MKLTHAIAVGVVAGCLGCGHAKTTDANTPAQAEERTPPADKPDRVATPHHEGGGAHHAKDTPAETAGIPVVSSPEGLLAPGAEAQIRDKLADGGYLDKNDKDASMEAGLRKFQKARDLPQTGVPNHETIQALGLDGNRIFKHADVNK